MLSVTPIPSSDTVARELDLEVHRPPDSIEVFLAFISEAVLLFVFHSAGLPLRAVQVNDLPQPSVEVVGVWPAYVVGSLRHERVGWMIVIVTNNPSEQRRHFYAPRTQTRPPAKGAPSRRFCSASTQERSIQNSTNRPRPGCVSCWRSRSTSLCR